MPTTSRILFDGAVTVVMPDGDELVAGDGRRIAGPTPCTCRPANRRRSCAST